MFNVYSVHLRAGGQQFGEAAALVLFIGNAWFLNPLPLFFFASDAVQAKQAGSFTATKNSTQHDRGRLYCCPIPPSGCRFLFNRKIFLGSAAAAINNPSDRRSVCNAAECTVRALVVLQCAKTRRPKTTLRCVRFAKKPFLRPGIKLFLVRFFFFRSTTVLAKVLGSVGS